MVAILAVIETRTEIPSSEILEKIQKGEPIEYDDVRIIGDLDLSKLDLPTETVERTEFQLYILQLSKECKIVSSSIKITNSEFKDGADFSNIKFICNIDFSKTTFSKDTGFKGSAFSGDIGFKGSRFSGDADFRDATFGGYADFRDATFDGYANFRDATFGGYADFRDATFDGYANFRDATFSRHATFDGSQFGSGVNFDAAIFSFYASLIHTEFIGLAKFYLTEFSGDAIFDDANFKGGCDFGHTKFMRFSSFWNTQIDKEISFRYAKFGSPKSQEQLSRIGRNFSEQNGNKADSDYYYYQEMDAIRKQKPRIIRYPEFFFIQLVTGYGVYPFRLYSWWLLFVVFFAIVYWIGGGVVGAKEPIDYIWFSITTAITPGFAGYSPAGMYKIVAGIEAILGSMLWAVFLATFANKYFRRS
jgi:uncharacterized protein YjbI with pentapeptide repeats